MKYSKEWKDKITIFPDSLINSSINYKKWKKILKSNDNNIDVLLNTLEQECRKLDIIFKNLYKHVIFHRWWYREHIDINIVLEYAQLNTRTIYKLCKKINKKLISKNATKWLNNRVKLHTYAFLGSHMTRYLEYIVGRNDNVNNLECPICFHEKIENDNTSYLILPCGHEICFECALQQTKMTTYKGTWFNLLASANPIDCKCPICRMPMAFQMTRQIEFIKK